MIVTQKNRQFLPFLLEKKLKRSYEICLFSPRLSKFILAPKQEVNLPQASEITFVSKTKENTLWSNGSLCWRRKIFNKTNNSPNVSAAQWDTQTFLQLMIKNTGLKVECQEWKTKIDSKMATMMMDTKPISCSLGFLHRRPPPGGNKD